ncbi:hypothetical protein BDN72DRAFT_894490 [Pluteus cervinus]|uniref:Uncharacterized protein n=1 Tax=Pluteus cervinus TaxID=181527 RepID=A0ACD3B4N0_9AGAR|nr:hypothetical protein BDN72DRAFT_894490 [Pluteus cervinus]
MTIKIYQNEGASGSTSQLSLEEVQTMLAYVNLITGFNKKLENQRTDLSQQLETLQTQINQREFHHAEDINALETKLKQTETQLREAQIERDQERQRANQVEAELNTQKAMVRFQAEIEQTDVGLAEERERLETRLKAIQARLTETKPLRDQKGQKAGQAEKDAESISGLCLVLLVILYFFVLPALKPRVSD